LLCEIPVILYSPAFERIATNDHYVRHQAIYSGSGPTGLFSFEDRVLSEYFPKPPARILVHGAGGGREMFALLERGFEVDGFEPVPELVEKAQAALASMNLRTESASIRCATIQEWARSPTGNFDAVLTGWGMWTHILRHAERVELLQAFRQVCPRGPVLLSFWRKEDVFFNFEKARDPMPLHPRWKGIERLTRDYIRQNVLHLAPIERGTGWAQGFFIHRVSEDELQEEAQLASYRLAFYEHDNFCYPHAVLVPEEDPSDPPSR
jgi:hypothetical protein